jgi:UDP-glucose 4-epimerase
MTILITGGGGFIGLNLAYDLVGRGQQVLLVRRHAFQVPSFLSAYIGKQVIIAEADISEPVELYRLIKKYHVDSVIHAAVVNESSPGNSLYQAMKVNLQGTTDILEASCIFGLKRVTFLSSVSVYMPPKNLPRVLYEDDEIPAATSDWISGSKKAGEQICQLFAREYNLSIPIVRPPQVWGPLYWTGRSPIKSMLENALAGRSTDLSQFDCFTRNPYIYVRDCVKALSLVHLAPSLKHGIYNISEGESHSLADFARAIKEIIPQASFRLGEERPPEDEATISMNTDRLKEEVGFAPDYPLKRAIQVYLEWMRDGKYS